MGRRRIASGKTTTEQFKDLEVENKNMAGAAREAQQIGVSVGSTGLVAEKGFFQIGKGEGGFEEWISGLENVMTWVGTNAFRAQVNAAEAVADLLRNFLAAGVEPELSPMTIALAGVKRPPLAALAKHVITKRPTQRRLKGKFAAKFHPSAVTFEDGWHRKAFVLEKGAIFVPPTRVRYALMQKVLQVDPSFLQNEGMGTGGVWILPARPFSHVLTGQEAKGIVRETVLAAFSNRPTPAEKNGRPAWMDVVEEEIDDREVFSYDDIAGGLADPSSLDAFDLIEF
jgi:hypothetical protein